MAQVSIASTTAAWLLVMVFMTLAGELLRDVRFGHFCVPPQDQSVLLTITSKRSACQAPVTRTHQLLIQFAGRYGAMWQAGLTQRKES